MSSAVFYSIYHQKFLPTVLLLKRHQVDRRYYTVMQIRTRFHTKKKVGNPVTKKVKRFAFLIKTSFLFFF